MELAIGFVLAVLGALYTIIGLVARNYPDNAKTHEDGVLYVPLWPCYLHMFDEYGRSPCRIGKWLFLFTWGGALLFVIVF